MNSTFGNNLRITVFGESHSKAIGMTIDGIPSGIKIDIQAIKDALALRRPDGDLSSSRIEEDEFEFLCGELLNITTGSPLTFIIKNNNTDSSEYEKGIVRPSHADITNFVKFGGHNDYRGGGFSSGRVTASFIILGVICKSILSKYDVNVLSRIQEIHGVNDINVTDSDFIKLYENIDDKRFPVLDVNKEILMKEEIIKAKKDGDSVGGVVETLITNVPMGLGEPYFDSFESILSHLIFSLGGVKGISFGDGFDFAKVRGSEVLDICKFENGKLKYVGNHNSGILGGITSGNVIRFKVAIKPTPSIFKSVQTADMVTCKTVNKVFKGRFDPCFVQRVLPVITALSYYAVVDLLMSDKAKHI